MAQWGWKAIVYCMCVTVVVMVCACTPTPSLPKYTPTELPPLTLTVRVNSALSPPGDYLLPLVATPAPASTATPAVYIAQTGDTLTIIGENFGILPPVLQTANPQIDPTIGPFEGQQVRIPQPVASRFPQPVQPAPPDCYPNQPDTFLCLGVVKNTLAFPVQRVTLEVALVNRDGSVSISQIVSTALSVITAGDSAPYHATFPLDAVDEQVQSVRVTLLSAEPAAPPRSVLTAREIGSEQQNGHYTLQLEISNNGPREAYAVRVVAYVIGPDAQVLGYRISEVGTLARGDSKSVTMYLPLAVPAEGARHVVLVEAES